MRDLPVAEIRSALLDWYRRHRRDLPWRVADDGTPDPYRVWLSEVMLQQTRVETALPFYERWLARFPTLAALAEAPLDDALKAWEGLGYYSRARHLHAAARLVVERHHGVVPDDPASFRALPGVGRYTAGAVMSIAFGRPEPVVDGNVRRVLARLADEPEPRDAELWRLAGDLVRTGDPAALNQSLMELGALVCRPRTPRCDACPVRASCAAAAAGAQDSRPLPRKQRPVPHQHEAVAVTERDGRLLLGRRSDHGRLGGLWEFPAVVRRAGESGGAAAERALGETMGLEGRAVEALGRVEHAFTHLRVTYHAVRCEARGEPRPLRYDRVVWQEADRLDELAMPAAQRRIQRLALPPLT